MKRIGTSAIAIAFIVGLIGCSTAPTQYNLTISATEGGGITTPGEETSGYDEGTVVPIVAFPHAGYRFVNWAGDVGTIDDVNAASTTIMMNDNYSITANSIAQYVLTVNSADGGEVTVPGEGTFTYDEGTIVILEASPDTGYRFLNWTGDVGSISDVNATVTTITINTDCAVAASFEEDEVVTFVDDNLEAVVRQAIAKSEGPIYAQDMEQLTQFDAGASGISDLTGMEYATSLTILGLWSNRISDIAPLASLTDLTVLDLQNNQISDIAPLGNLTKLTSLFLTTNGIRDISPLVDNDGFSEGDEVHLSGNPLSSTSINIYIPELEARGVIVDY